MGDTTKVASVSASDVDINEQKNTLNTSQLHKDEVEVNVDAKHVEEKDASNENLPELEDDEGEKSSLVASASSEDFVDVQDDDNLLTAKLVDICKIDSDEAEEFIHKNDVGLIRAMINNDLLRE